MKNILIILLFVLASCSGKSISEDQKNALIKENIMISRHLNLLKINNEFIFIDNKFNEKLYMEIKCSEAEYEIVKSLVNLKANTIPIHVLVGGDLHVIPHK